MNKPSIVTKTRVWILYIGLFTMMGFLVVRASYLYFNEAEVYSEYGLKRSIKSVVVPASKGMIKDRNGEVLAATTVVYRLVVDLNHLRVKSSSSSRQKQVANYRIDKFKQHLADLSKIIEKPIVWIHEKTFLQNPKKMQSYLAKDLHPEKVAKIKALKIPALVFERKLKRYYPHGEILAHIVGFSDYVNVGRSGVEKYYDNYLKGQSGKKWLRRDRAGDVISYVVGDGEFKRGKDLNLSIDVKIQNLVFAALHRSLEEHNATSGAAVVLEADTGDILAMTSLPSYNTNDFSQRVGSKLSNTAIQELFELGSIIKPFLALSGLESGAIDEKTKLYLGEKQPKHQIKIKNYTFKDSSPLQENMISVATMLKKSSNVGAIQLGLRIKDKQLLNTLSKVGFGQPINIGLYGGKIKGVLPKKLNKLAKASLSIGYGANASLIQMARAYSVLANEGRLIENKLILDELVSEKQVIDPKDIKQVNRWLLGVSQKDGTAPLAKIDGFEVIGKTGTTLISKGKEGYEKDKYIATFVGFVPYKNPEIVVAVLIQNPKGKKYYGGEVAAPVFAEIATHTLDYLGIRPNEQKSLLSALNKMKL